MADIKIQSMQQVMTPGLGLQTFEIPGFGTPKAAIFSYSQASALNTNTSRAVLGVGFTDGLQDAVLAGRANDAEAASNTARVGNANTAGSFRACIAYPQQGGNSNDGSASFSAWAANGVTINIDVAFPANILLNVTLISGADLDLFVGYADANGTTPVVAGTPWEADALLMLYSARATTGWSANWETAYGMLTNDGVGGVVQRCITKNGVDNTNPVNNAAYYSTTDIIAALFNGATAQTVSASAFTASGFTMTVTGGGIGQNGYQYLAMRLNNSAQIAMVDLTSPGATGNQAVTGVGFEPGAVLEMLSSVSVADVLRTGSESGFGFAVLDATATVGATASNTDGVTPDVAKSQTSDNIVLYGDNDTINNESTLVSFDADGWTENFSVADATPRLGLALVFEGAGGPALPVLSNPTTPVYTP